MLQNQVSESEIICKNAYLLIIFSCISVVINALLGVLFLGAFLLLLLLLYFCGVFYFFNFAGWFVFWGGKKAYLLWVLSNP